MCSYNIILSILDIYKPCPSSLVIFRSLLGVYCKCDTSSSKVTSVKNKNKTTTKNYLASTEIYPLKYCLSATRASYSTI